MTPAPALAAPDVRILGGVPFVSDTFVPGRLLGAVVAVRHFHATQRDLPGLPDLRASELWLRPAFAAWLRRDGTPVQSTVITDSRHWQIYATLNRIADRVPPWAPLLRVPVKFMLLPTENPSLSASSYLWPQHLMLGRQAFDDDITLAEFLTHEMCHQWQYLIEEVWPFDLPDARRVSLPSGTPNRAPREVIGAAHVSAALLRLYRADNSDDHTARITQLTWYGQGCLALLEDLDGDLTDTGRTITRQLQEAL